MGKILFTEIPLFTMQHIKRLDQGFEVKLGASFEAYIDGCGGN